MTSSKALIGGKCLSAIDDWSSSIPLSPFVSFSFSFLFVSHFSVFCVPPIPVAKVTMGKIVVYVSTVSGSLEVRRCDALRRKLAARGERAENEMHCFLRRSRRGTLRVFLALSVHWLPIAHACARQLKKKQSRIEATLQSKKIPYELRDVSASDEFKEFMRAKSGQNSPPQIFDGDTYLGVCLFASASFIRVAHTHSRSGL